MGLDDFLKNTEKKETPFGVKEKISQQTKLIKVDEDVHKELKIFTAKTGANIKETAEQAIKEFLERNN
ncbi:hypothetical protein [Lactococcus lactis]|jgi:Omega Transcriptional Repressor.|uniref:hypothetical protein n=1 Tax=Lactococcus lactis TaxID=1358 RepID=UPI00288DC430|nr:hypothetical protein [Lactococcus lactis]MDT2909341.1 hypothetical protein [Lactococcus lactis]MDT2925129.1 hypothetical protein [Lactococcus lactis]MDT2951988.1 hypothetical protein [Lactococcus lactis]